MSEWSNQVEATSLFVAMAMLILLAVTSMRFGVDSREAFSTKERELAARGIVWGGASSAADRRLAREARPTTPAGDCVPAPCAA